MKKINIGLIFYCFLFTFCKAEVADNGTFLLSGGVSSASNLSANKPSESGELYGIGSVSKVFTAAAVLKLVEEDKINLDTPLTSYIREFEMADPRYTQITPRMLLNHSSGLMGSTFNNGLLLGDNDTYNHDNFLNMLKVQTFKHDPGERLIYCNDGFTLAEILIERVSGISFTEYLEVNFFEPLGLKNIKTPQSKFDRSLLANIYMGNNELLHENFNVIGSGGIYASMEDLCRFAQIFMDDAATLRADGSMLLKKSSIEEMARNHHINEMIYEEDTIFRYGLGWDAVELYPFSQFDIKALSKGGATFAYNTELTVLPEYNIAAAVSSSGSDALEQLIAQEIILAVLIEEGIIPADTTLSIPRRNLDRAIIPESIKTYTGIYDGGFYGLINIEFAGETLRLTPIGVKNERPQIYIYNTDGEFISTNDDYIGLRPPSATRERERGITALSFSTDKNDVYLVMRTYLEERGLSISAVSMPFAKKLTENSISDAVKNTWRLRNGKEYLLVSEKHSSSIYLSFPLLKLLIDDRVSGYVGNGIYEGKGLVFPWARIIDGQKALGYQNIPTMAGRDIKNIYAAVQNGVEYISVNDIQYIDASSILKFSDLQERLVIGAETVWVDIDSVSAGKAISINITGSGHDYLQVNSQAGSWFVYDDKMNCIATSLERNPRSTIILPVNGRLAFAGVEGTQFIINK